MNYPLFSLKKIQKCFLVIFNKIMNILILISGSSSIEFWSQLMPLQINNLQQKLPTSNGKINGPPFPCIKCGRFYKYLHGLRAHVKYECGKPPSFHCDFCPKSFHLAGNKNKHMLLVHSVSATKMKDIDFQVLKTLT